MLSLIGKRFRILGHYRVAIAEGIHSDGIPIETDGSETWNEDIHAISKDVPPGFEDAAKKFNISGSVRRTLNAILGIGLVVAMSFSLANDWGSLSDTGKVLGVLNIVVHGLTVVLDLIDAGIEIELWVVTGTMSVALPILGAVLTVIRIDLNVIQVLVNLFIGRQDPPDPIADFIKDVGHKLIGAFDAAPAPQLTYLISDHQVSADKVATITIKVRTNLPVM